MPRFKNTMAASTLHSLGISYHAVGVISDRATGRRMFDYYTADSVSQESRAALLAIAPDVQFKPIGPAFAPEIRKVAVCFPKAAFYASSEART